MKWFQKHKPKESFLDHAFERILQGENVTMGELFSKWDEDDGSFLQKASEKQIREATEARDDFLKRMEHLGLSIENRYQMCEEMCVQSERAPSAELLRITCEVICDTGLMLDRNRAERTDEQDALCWQKQKQDVDSLLSSLHERMEQAGRFQAVVNHVRKITISVECPTGEEIQNAEALCVAFEKIFGADGQHQILTDNLSELLHTSGLDEMLSLLKPLFLYQAITRHLNRLRTSENLHIDFMALWNLKQYRLDADNGRNYSTYIQYLSLFEALCDFFETDTTVDIPLCVYGFDKLSNLGDFYRMYPAERQKLPFDPSMEDIVSQSLFTCDEGAGNPILEQRALSYEQLDQFQSGKVHRYEYALNRIENYLNDNLDRWVDDFLKADRHQLTLVCAAVLNEAVIPAALRPRTEEEAALLQASIYEALTEAVDDRARSYLCETLKNCTQMEVMS